MRREQTLWSGKAKREPAASRGPFAEYITTDSGLLRTFAHLQRVANSTANILLTGETGTGKGLLAQCIHDASRQRKGPFVAVNCAAIPETLLESELFGHVAGAFTGARREKRGLFQEAGGGALFLDEISRTSLAVQAKLLHALDTREIRPVGATETKHVDVRILCASNVNLWDAIRSGTFLEDLYYRLSDFTVLLPPLRERAGDVPLLFDHFYERICREMGRRPKGVSREVRACMLDHAWRGNIRELVQVVRRLVALSTDGEIIDVDLLPSELCRARTDHSQDGNGRRRSPRSESARAAAKGNRLGLRDQIAQLEKYLIAEALAATRWNRTKAAQRLGISYPNLLAKIRLFGLTPRRKPAAADPGSPMAAGGVS